MELQIRNQIKIKIYNVILNYIQNHGWINYAGFADDFTDEILNEFDKGNFNLDSILSRTKHSFLKLNHIKTAQFLNQSFTDSLYKAWNKAKKYGVPLYKLTDIFPELEEIEYSKAKLKISKLKIAESIIQESLRDALREKGASPMAGRGKDSALEIADLEHFNLKINDRDFSFSAVVKGYNSLSKVTPKEIMHQITKAYITHPDYILLVVAKDPVDFLVTQVKLYAKDVGNLNLVIIVTPIELARFLIWRKII